MINYIRGWGDDWHVFNAIFVDDLYEEVVETDEEPLVNFVDTLFYQLVCL